ncbi:RNA polymerase sigma factor [Cellulophaga fucicola]|uniref:RNA polymerase sigma-70 factor, ECF subfamily n=1 Tax=Cellulophaga fucicola TaxID=76595 RepID=A0A1K1MWN9_9FLAO|nr:RNA polymerase sigma-70 factor [Cellulophaga fucicola]SFW27531.1 RNA polymerase sigma-70 factor, ECF subfamily [Cellulophaga fucicola]
MSPPLNSDINFINALKSGDASAYNKLVNNYHQKLCVYAYNLAHDRSEAEDIVQNVFMRVWRKRDKLKADFSLQSFLYKSVYNEFIDHYRKQKSVFPLEKKYLDAFHTLVEETDVSSFDILIKKVKQEIQNLPPKCKKVFLLSKQEGLTNIEIAEYLEISIKTVEAQITKAFYILRTKINKTDSNVFLYLSVLKLKKVLLFKS